MNNRRKLIIAIGASTIAAPLASFAQQQTQVFRIGFLGSASASGYSNMVEALRLGLREMGYVEGKNLAIEFRWADEQYDRLPGLAKDLIRQNISVLVTHGTPAIRAARQVTQTVPIVMVTSSDAVASGLISTLARPGGNITGSTLLNPEINAKRLELIKEAAPRIQRVAVILNANNPSNAPILQAMEKAAQSLRLTIKVFEVRQLDELKKTLPAIAKGADAVTISQDAIFFENARAIAELMTKVRLPSAGFKEFAEAGGLIGYGPNYLELYRRAAYFMDRILKGAKPADLPVEQPTKFELVINLKPAKALGIKIPNSILVRADKVIE
jgi:putative ABC transport system substrate-binding protein